MNNTIKIQLLLEKIIKEASASSSNEINLNDGQIKYYNTLWNKVHSKYTYNTFWQGIMKQVNSKKSLTAKQKWFLDFLFKHGKSPYEAEILPSNY